MHTSVDVTDEIENRGAHRIGLEGDRTFLAWLSEIAEELDGRSRFSPCAQRLFGRISRRGEHGSRMVRESDHHEESGLRKEEAIRDESCSIRPSRHRPTLQEYVGEDVTGAGINDETKKPTYPKQSK